MKRWATFLGVIALAACTSEFTGPLVGSWSAPGVSIVASGNGVTMMLACNSLQTQRPILADNGHFSFDATIPTSRDTLPIPVRITGTLADDNMTVQLRQLRGDTTTVSTYRAPRGSGPFSTGVVCRD